MNARARHFDTANHELANLMVEALATVITVAEAEALVVAGLTMAELDAVPERPEELLFFSSGPLYECAQRALGRAQADELLAAMSPVLDRAWKLDRETVAQPSPEATSETLTAGGRTISEPVQSGVTRGAGAAGRGLSEPVVSSGVQRKPSHVRRAEPPPPPVGDEAVADTIPAADDSYRGFDVVHGPDSAPDTQSQPEVAVLDAGVLDAGALDAGALDSASLDTWADLASEPPGPSSRGRTIPYMPAVLAPGQGARRVLVIDADAELRHALAESLRKAGITVATAADVRVAERLIRRFAPTVVVADLETVAPDYEPLRPVLDDLLEGLDSVSVVLLDDQRRGETAERVRRSFEKPVTAQRIADVVDDLLA